MRLISILLLIVMVPYGHAATRDGRVPQRIERVVNGLLPLVLIKGKPITKMNLTDRMKYYKIPGVSIAVINNYQIEWARGFGVVEAGTTKLVPTDTLFQAGSISKPITAVAAMKFVQDGKLILDADVNQRLRSWKIPDNEFTKEQKVTLRRILSHAAGLTNSGVGEYTCNEQKPTLLQALEGKPPSKNPSMSVDFIPGSAAEYNWPDYLHERTLVKLDPASVGALVGRYEVAPGFILTIVIENGRLLLKDGEAELLPESKTVFSHGRTPIPNLPKINRTA